MDLTLQDEVGPNSAAESLAHVQHSLRNKVGEPVLIQPNSPTTQDVDALKKQILYIAAFHDSMFGTFNQRSTLPDQERAEFIELFLLAVASVIPGGQITIDLTAGTVSSNAV